MSAAATNNTISFMRVLTTVYPEFTDAARHIRRMTLAQRSLVIKLCQAQYAVTPSSPPSTLESLIASAPFYRAPFSNDLRDLKGFAAEFEAFIVSPVSSAILLDICRSCPLDIIEITAAQAAGWNKEIVCCETIGAEPRINWLPIFDPVNHRQESILPGVPPNPAMAHAGYLALRRWINSMNGRVLYPRMTHRNMSWATRRNYEMILDGREGRLLDVPIFGQDNWQRFYYDTGIQVEGECEMRQKWYPSQAKPRTYYAQGGSTYRVSAILQDAFTDLADVSPITHHLHRLRPTRLRLKKGSHLRIYDLSSFTSRMVEQKAFVRHLAIMASQVSVQVVDVRHGLLTRNLGEMLEEYNEICNRHPEVSYERAFKGSHGYHLADHGMASMLGIFGNLMTCTSAHGLAVSQVVQQEDEINCAGDDGAVIETDANREALDICICAIGDYEKSKTFRSDEDGCICLKRPLWEDDGIIKQGISCIPPNLALIQHLAFGIADPRYSFLSDPDDRPLVIAVLGKDLLRFLRSVYRASYTLTDTQLQHAINVYLGLTGHLNLPTSGGVPQCGDPFFWPQEPTLESLRTEDPLITLLYSRYRGFVEVPVRDYLPCSVSLSHLDVGDTFRCNSSKPLTLLRKLGLLKSRKVLRLGEDAEGFEQLAKSFSDFRTPYVYEFEVLEPIPPYLSMF